MVATNTIIEQKPDLQTPRNSRGAYKYHDQPTHLEHVVNDINEELSTTDHGLKVGPTSLLRFFATVAWTSKTDHPEWYGTVHPKFATIKVMANMIGASERATSDYLAALDDAHFIHREKQHGDRYKISLRWTDKDRKLRFGDIYDLVRSSLVIVEDKQKKYDNRYYVNKRTGQFWRRDNHKHTIADDEVLVTLTAEESRFFWNKTRPPNTTERRKIMQRLTDPGGHAWLAQVVAEFNQAKRASQREDRPRRVREHNRTEDRVRERTRQDILNNLQGALDPGYRAHQAQMAFLRRKHG